MPKITGYVKNDSQEGRILNLLRERGNAGAFVYEFMMPRPGGLGIAQYSARIFGLRGKGYEIVNTHPGHFILIEEGQRSLL